MKNRVFLNNKILIILLFLIGYTTSLHAAEIARWTLNNTLHDTIGSNDLLTYYNAGFATEDGRTGINLDQIPKYLYSSKNIGLSGNTSFSVAAWVKSKRSNGWDTIFQIKDFYDIHFLFYSGDIRSRISNNTLSTNISPSNRWDHAVVTYDSVTRINSLYVNGMKVAETTLDTDINIIDNKAQIGTHSGAEFYEGLISDVRVFNNSLDIDHIKEIYAASLDGNSSQFMPIRKNLIQNSDPTSFSTPLWSTFSDLTKWPSTADYWDDTGSFSRHQTIDLMKAGFSTEFMDSSPPIRISESFREAYCPDDYYINIYLLDNNLNEVSSWKSGIITTTGTPLGRCSWEDDNAQWKSLTQIIQNYPEGVRYIRWEDGGKGHETWGGKFGAIYRNPYLSIDANTYVNRITIASATNSDTFLQYHTDNNSVFFDNANNAFSHFDLSPGLSDPACFSFEASNKPNHFLQQVGSETQLEVFVKTENFKKSVTFCPENGLFDDNLFSLNSASTPNHYLMKSGNRLILANVTNRIARTDATMNLIFVSSNESVPISNFTSIPSINDFRGEVKIGLFSDESLYLRHQGNIAKMSNITSVLDHMDSSFVMKEGLADSHCVSFESLNYPEHYLRHSGSKIILSKDDQTELLKLDATFCIRSGIKSSNGESFESFNYRNYYIHNDGTELSIKQGEGDVYAANTTFVIKENNHDYFPEHHRSAQPLAAENQLEVKLVRDFKFIWEDKNSGGKNRVMIYRPDIAGVSYLNDYYSLGDIAIWASYYQHDDINNYQYYNQPYGYVIKDEGNGLVSAPKDYQEIWNDTDSGARTNVTFWKPIPEDGYKCLGHIATPNHHEKPDTNLMRCIYEDLVTGYNYNKKVYDDTGTGSKHDVSIFKAEYRYDNVMLGPETMIAFPNTHEPNRNALQEEVLGIKTAAIRKYNQPEIELKVVLDNNNKRKSYAGKFQFSEAENVAGFHPIHIATPGNEVKAQKHKLVMVAKNLNSSHPAIKAAKSALTVHRLPKQKKCVYDPWYALSHWGSCKPEDIDNSEEFLKVDQCPKGYSVLSARAKDSTALHCLRNDLLKPVKLNFDSIGNDKATGGSPDVSFFGIKNRRTREAIVPSALLVSARHAVNDQQKTFFGIKIDAVKDSGLGTYFVRDKGECKANTPDSVVYPVLEHKYIEDLILSKQGKMKGMSGNDFINPALIEGVGILTDIEAGAARGTLLKEDNCDDLQYTAISYFNNPSKNTVGHYSWALTMSVDGNVDSDLMYAWNTWESEETKHHIKHAELTEGRPVRCAGEFYLFDGVNNEGETTIVINDDSGHYRPSGSVCGNKAISKLKALGFEDSNIESRFSK